MTTATTDTVPIPDHQSVYAAIYLNERSWLALDILLIPYLI